MLDTTAQSPEGLLTKFPDWQVHRGCGCWTAVRPGPDEGEDPLTEFTVADTVTGGGEPDVEAAVRALRGQMAAYEARMAGRPPRACARPGCAGPAGPSAAGAVR